MTFETRRADDEGHKFMIDAMGAEAYDQGVNPYTGDPVGDPVPHTDHAGLDRVCAAALGAAPRLAALSLPHRARLLRELAAALEAHRKEIVELADAETGLGEARLDSELTRTRVQLEMFAEVIREGSFLDAVIDLADPDALPAPRPDL
ncbi:MAG: aldehyde dehydrogenase family protein, partial [Micromonosporaceae bacterium]